MPIKIDISVLTRIVLVEFISLLVLFFLKWIFYVKLSAFKELSYFLFSLTATFRVVIYSLLGKVLLFFFLRKKMNLFTRVAIINLIFSGSFLVACMVITDAFSLNSIIISLVVFLMSPYFTFHFFLNKSQKNNDEIIDGDIFKSE